MLPMFYVLESSLENTEGKTLVKLYSVKQIWQGEFNQSKTRYICY